MIQAPSRGLDHGHADAGISSKKGVIGKISYEGSAWSQIGHLTHVFNGMQDRLKVSFSQAAAPALGP
ncbi:MAG TPA: hypothetical protein VK956_11970 [Verrucomicrobium sp.]|nr:hypothetical protein [Verrucomicrobium sp.]